MPDYVKKVLTRFQHTLPTKLEFAPYQHVIPNYGAKVQYSAEQDRAQLIDPKGINTIQSIVGTFLYYGIAIDNIILPALSNIAAEQSTATKTTTIKITKL